jgi:hypothetical protein
MLLKLAKFPEFPKFPLQGKDNFPPGPSAGVAIQAAPVLFRATEWRSRKARIETKARTYIDPRPGLREIERTRRLVTAVQGRALPRRSRNRRTVPRPVVATRAGVW